MIVHRGSAAALPLPAGPAGIGLLEEARPLRAGASHLRWLGVALLVLIAFQLVFSLPVGAPARSAPGDIFQDGFDSYLVLRDGVERSIPPQGMTSDAAEILRREQRLGVAMGSRRGGTRVRET